MKQIAFGDKAYQPSKLVCVGRNYLAHIAELNNAVPDKMVLFHKPNSAITQTLSAQHLGETLHYEVELAFVVEQGQLRGVGLALDLTKRQLQSELKSQGLPWERAKAFDGSAVVSRFLPISEQQIDHLQVELFINCVRVQCGFVQQMIYSPHEILNEVSAYATLNDGDLLLTGTPEGVGAIHQGDRFVARLKCQETTLLEVEWLAH